ncbi:hypothetical protein RJ640_028501 [Escallonia rubra]|uniref:Acyl carrier protein n=1 Tax=Escallonia rubra TaxID=112253 RepID=A0AA88RLY7_9ASTE|nr:hypothetical protein RJ640_028501 [Escallonia rubra]
MALALRAAILRHARIPVVQTLTLNGSKLGLFGTVRSMSSHGDDNLDKQAVVDRVLDVIKSYPKVDPSKEVDACAYTYSLAPIFYSVLQDSCIIQVTTDVHFQKDLGLDSLDTVEIVMALEEEFKLEIPDKEADKIDSCPLAIEYIYNHPMAS